MVTKICSKCNKEFPLTKEFFRFQKDRNSFRANCRKCDCNNSKKYYHNNPLSKEQRERKKKYGREWYQKNKEHIKEYQKNNKERIRELQTKNERPYRLLIDISKCEECGIKKEDIKCKEGIVVHHIDGNHNNNKINNLMALCSKCHFFKHKPSRWKGDK